MEEAGEWCDSQLQQQLEQWLGNRGGGLGGRAELRRGLGNPYMRRKSPDSPGSVLALLTEHVREQMEQAATMEVDAKGQQVTSGVKVCSYFNLHVKPNYGAHLRELREMYMLAVTIDFLRKGDLPRVGDALSARFMAIHQALVDQSWTSSPHGALSPRRAHSGFLCPGAGVEEAQPLSGARAGERKLAAKLQGPCFLQGRLAELARRRTEKKERKTLKPKMQKQRKRRWKLWRQQRRGSRL